MIPADCSVALSADVLCHIITVVGRLYNLMLRCRIITVVIVTPSIEVTICSGYEVGSNESEMELTSSSEATKSVLNRIFACTYVVT